MIFRLKQPSRTSPLACAIALLACLATAGCKTQLASAPGAENLADTEVARLQIEPDVRFVSLDGQPVPGIAQIEGPGGTTEPRSARTNSDKRLIRIAPGTHRVIAGYAAYSEANNGGG